LRRQTAAVQLPAAQPPQPLCFSHGYRPAHTTTPVRKDDRGPCTVMEGSRGRGLEPTQAILVEVSALGAGGCDAKGPRVPPRSRSGEASLVAAITKMRDRARKLEHGKGQ
jgi:hypothetical protein